LPRPLRPGEAVGRRTPLEAALARLPYNLAHNLTVVDAFAAISIRRSISRISSVY